jgi:hypothetical protein
VQNAVGGLDFTPSTAAGGTTFSTPAMVILTGGNVGIGSTNPAHKLTIAGSFYSQLVSKGASGNSITIDWNGGNTQHVLLAPTTGSVVTISFTGGQSGGRYNLALKQDATGGRTVTWPASVRWGSGTAPTLTSGANKTDYIGFIYNGIDATYDGIAFNANF